METTTDTTSPPMPVRKRISDCDSADYRTPRPKVPTPSWDLAAIRKFLICAGVGETEICALSDADANELARTKWEESKIWEHENHSTHVWQSRWMQYWLLTRNAAIPKRHKIHLDAIIPNANEGWLKMLDLLKGKLTTGFMVALLGNRGTGKTQLATALIDHACLGGHGSRYAKASDIFRQIRATYSRSSEETEQDVFDTFITPKLLVIDELHQRNESPAENHALINILDHRYDAMKDTLLIANLDKKGFAESIGPSITSRIHESGDALVCDWKSFRTPGAWLAATPAPIPSPIPNKETLQSVRYAS